MSENFSSQEDKLNILLDKLTKTISTFTTLSKELAEKAIIETNLKIKEGETMIEKMEDFIKDNENSINKEEMIELNKKIINYKNEFNNLVNKFNNTQNKYINKKEIALIDLIDDAEINKNKKGLIDDETNDEKKEKNKKEEGKFKETGRNSIANNMAFEKNIGNISGVNNPDNNNINEDVFDSINIKTSKKKKKILCGILIILSVVIISVILYLSFFVKKSDK